MTHPREDLGAYALGALDAADERRVREHLASCEACRDEHARLAGLRPLLDLAAPALEADGEAEPPPVLEDAVLGRFAAERRRSAPARRHGVRRLRLAIPSALAGAAAAVAALAIAGAFGGEDDPSSTVELRGASGSARAVLVAGEPGTQIDLDARLPPSRRYEVYELWMVRGDWRVSAGSFRVGPDGHVRVKLACGAPPQVYDRIGITREPDAYDPARNGPSVLSAPLPS